MKSKTLPHIFKERLEELSAEYVGCEDIEDAWKKLRTMLIGEDWDQVALANDVPEWAVEALTGFAEPISVTMNETGGTVNNAGLSKVKAGITVASAVIAETGTVVQTSTRPGDRSISLIPPVHIVLMFGTTIYGTLEDFLETVDPNLSYQFISGPSRTADIEKELVLGVHGPVRLIVFGPLIESAEPAEVTNNE